MDCQRIQATCPLTASDRRSTGERLTGTTSNACTKLQIPDSRAQGRARRAGPHNHGERPSPMLWLGPSLFIQGGPNGSKRLGRRRRYWSEMEQAVNGATVPVVSALASIGPTWVGELALPLTACRFPDGMMPIPCRCYRETQVSPKSPQLHCFVTPKC